MENEGPAAIELKRTTERRRSDENECHKNKVTSQCSITAVIEGDNANELFERIGCNSGTTTSKEGSVIGREETRIERLDNEIQNVLVRAGSITPSSSSGRKSRNAMCRPNEAADEGANVHRGRSQCQTRVNAGRGR